LNLKYKMSRLQKNQNEKNRTFYVMMFLSIKNVYLFGEFLIFIIKGFEFCNRKSLLHQGKI